MHALLGLCLWVLGAIVALVVAAALRTGFRAHPELWLPLAVIAAAVMGALELLRVVRAAARETS